MRVSKLTADLIGQNVTDLELDQAGKIKAIFLANGKVIRAGRTYANFLDVLAIEDYEKEPAD